MEGTNLIQIKKSDRDRDKLFRRVMDEVVKFSLNSNGTFDVEKFYDSTDVLTQLIILRVSRRIIEVKPEITYKECKRLINKLFDDGTNAYLEKIFDFVKNNK